MPDSSNGLNDPSALIVITADHGWNIDRNNSKKIATLAKKNFVKITKIGNITKNRLIVINKKNEELLFNNLGFKHF